jgi:hypothetical protein
LEIIAYQECPSPPMTPELHGACERALHVLTRDGRRAGGGRAAAWVLVELGYPAAWLGRPPLLWFVEAGYRAVARSRGPISRLLRLRPGLEAYSNVGSQPPPVE